MSSIEIHPRASKVLVQEGELTVPLKDGRTIVVPISWFPRLLRASVDQREHYRLIGGGEGIHWPDIDEDLSVAGLLAEIQRRGPTAMLAATRQVGSFALCQPLEGKLPLHISQSPTGGSSSSHTVLVCRKGRKGRKPARSLFRHYVPDNINDQVGIYAPLLSGARSGL